jgi:hypothetical protein
MIRALPALALVAAFLPTPADTQRPVPAEVSVITFLRSHYPADAISDESPLRYELAWADLNGDRQPEAIAYISGGGYCGTGGCNLLVLTPAGRSWRIAGELSVTNPPIRLLATRTRGWRDLAVLAAGGGIRHAYEARLTFNGRTYPISPGDRGAIPVRGRVPGRVLIADDDRGRPLY